MRAALDLERLTKNACTSADVRAWSKDRLNCQPISGPIAVSDLHEPGINPMPHREQFTGFGRRLLARSKEVRSTCRVVAEGEGMQPTFGLSCGNRPFGRDFCNDRMKGGAGCEVADERGNSKGFGHKPTFTAQDRNAIASGAMRMA
jgi:hypothetical protein